MMMVMMMMTMMMMTMMMMMMMMMMMIVWNKHLYAARSDVERRVNQNAETVRLYHASISQEKAGQQARANRGVWP